MKWTSALFVLASLVPAPATTAAAAQNNTAPAGGLQYVFCEQQAGDPVTTYYSDVFAAPTGSRANLVNGFRQFVASKYNVTNANSLPPMCYAYGPTQEQAQSALKTDITRIPHKYVLTGWKYGETATPGTSAVASPSQPPATAAPAPAAAGVSAPAAAPVQPALVTVPNVTLVMRVVDPINSASDPAGREYRAVVTQPATAGSFTIPENALARLTLSQSQGTWTTQISSLTINGQQQIAASSNSVNASSPAQEVAKKVGGILSGLGRPAPAAAAATVSAIGNHVVLPPGTILTFTATVTVP